MINFDEASHTYTTEIEGAEMVVPSVSTIISNILDLDYSGIDPFYADRGTAVHKAIELLIADNLDEGSLDEEIIPFLNAYKKFVKETQFQPIHSEIRVFDKDLWVAGTLDLIGSIGENKVLIDIKTGQKQKWHQLQTAGYAILSGELDIKRYCLNLTKKETYKLEPHESKGDFSLFKSMADVFNRKGDYINRKGDYINRKGDYK